MISTICFNRSLISRLESKLFIIYLHLEVIWTLPDFEETKALSKTKCVRALHIKNCQDRGHFRLLIRNVRLNLGTRRKASDKGKIKTCPLNISWYFKVMNIVIMSRACVTYISFCLKLHTRVQILL